MKNSAGNFPRNSGQAVKDFLSKNNVDFSRLHYKSKERSDDRIRRCKRKFQGTDISIPCDPTNQAVKKELKELVNKCKYTLGELIVPQSFEKIILNIDIRKRDSLETRAVYLRFLLFYVK